MVDSHPSFVPKEALPYPVGRRVSGRIVSQLAPAIYKIDLSGRHYTAEVSKEKHKQAFSPGDPVMVEVVAKYGSKAMLEIIEPDFPDILSPTTEDISRLARSAGWPDDEASHVLVTVLVSRRLPLRSTDADNAYRKLKQKEHPTIADAEASLGP